MLLTHGNKKIHKPLEIIAITKERNHCLVFVVFSHETL